MIEVPMYWTLGEKTQGDFWDLVESVEEQKELQSRRRRNRVEAKKLRLASLDDREVIEDEPLGENVGDWMECDDCRVRMRRHAVNQKRCSVCSARAQRERQRQARQTRSGQNTVKAKCDVCGETFWKPPGRRKRCSRRCSSKAHRELVCEYNRRKRAARKVRKQSKKGKA